MFAPLTVFLDLETTGLSPRAEGITEIGAIVCREGEVPREWSTLVRPPRPIPPEIATLTGITNDMVRDAPAFADVAEELAALLEGAVLVAHNARFDYAFLKQSFARLGTTFFVPTLCTARLARELEPGLEGAGLDALIGRYGLTGADRHRALGDARLTFALAQAMLARHNADDVEAAVKRVLRRPSLPKHLPPDTLARLPEGPGVYLFYGLNEHPLYIGKAKSLRERVGQHFSGDWMSERGVRLADELRRIETVETAGELSALLLEAELVRTRMPAHNVALRRRGEAVMLRPDHARRQLVAVEVGALVGESPAGLYGPFSSRRAARAALAWLCDEHALCRKALGLEKKRRGEAEGTPCFAFQVKRCRGACCGGEGEAEHWARALEALAPQVLPPWPFADAVELVETDPDSERTARFTVRDWCLVDASGALQAFEAATFGTLRPYLEGRKRNPAVVLR